MGIESFINRIKDENIGPKDRMLIINIGGGAITRYVGPCTLAHAQYIKDKIDARENKLDEERELNHKSIMEYYNSKDEDFKSRVRPPTKNTKTLVSIIELEKPPYACDPISENNNETY